MAAAGSTVGPTFTMERILAQHREDIGRIIPDNGEASQNVARPCGQERDVD
jgi:hypothetical protein